MSGGGMEQRRMPKSFWKNFSPVIKTEEEQPGKIDTSKDNAVKNEIDIGSKDES